MTYSKHSLHCFLEDLTQSCVNKFYCLNEGGCGIFAKFIADELDRRNITYNFVIQGLYAHYKDRNCEELYINNTLYARHLMNFYISANHIWIIIGNFHINKDQHFHGEKVNRRLNRRIKENLESSYRQDNYVTPGDRIWNCDFNLSDIPKLQKFIAKQFKKFDTLYT